MLCQSCGQTEANVHLQHIVDDNKREVHLCEDCAGKNGIKVDNPISLTDIMVGLGDLANIDEGESQKACPLCGLTIAEFRKSSQIGCTVCYETFRAELAQLLSGVHKGDQHIGKTPVGLAASGDNDPKVVALQDEINEAVAREDYEQAAEARDQILRHRAKYDEEAKDS